MLRCPVGCGAKIIAASYVHPPTPLAFTLGTESHSWQGHSVAQWQYASSPRGAPRRGNLKVVTTNLRAGYVRKNGAPHSEKAVVTEYFDLNTAPNGDQWITVTTKVEDPVYFTRPYITTTDFKKLPGADGWNPTPCSAR